MRNEEYDDGYDSKESFERAGCDREEDMEPEEPEEEPTPRHDPWIICPTCSGDGHHCRHLGAYTMEEFDEAFPDAEDREDYFSGVYDKTCETCAGAGKVRQSVGLKRHEQVLRNESGFNEAGEPLW